MNRQYTALDNATGQGCFNFPTSINTIPQGSQFHQAEAEKDLRLQTPRHTRHKSPSTEPQGWCELRYSHPTHTQPFPSSKIKVQKAPGFLPVRDCPRPSSGRGTGALGTKPAPFLLSPRAASRGTGSRKPGSGWQAGILELLIAVPRGRHPRNAD